MVTHWVHMPLLRNLVLIFKINTTNKGNKEIDLESINDSISPIRRASTSNQGSNYGKNKLDDFIVDTNYLVTDRSVNQQAMKKRRFRHNHILDDSDEDKV